MIYQLYKLGNNSNSKTKVKTAVKYEEKHNNCYSELLLKS